MLRVRITAAIAVCSTGLAVAQSPRATPQPPYARPAPAAVIPVAPIPAKKPTLLDVVAEKYREQVAQVIKAPTLATKATDEAFTAHPAVYDWLLEHPDRTTVAWQRLKVPSVDITDLGKGQFFWSDEAGSELAWQAVGRFENGIVWYATGKVKGGALLPTVPVRAVAVLHAPREVDPATGAAAFKPTLHVYILSDSRLATVAMRVMGSDAAKMAEQGAEQLLFFFSGVARYLHKKPDQVEALLGAKKK
jgi:hypothetical protein